MTNSMLSKVQLHYNIDELREIDDDCIDDDVSGWWAWRCLSGCGSWRL